MNNEKAKKRTAAQKKYDDKNTRRVSLKLNNGSDADIIAEIDKADSVQGKIKELIRKGMKA